jgi:hypothetical protein
VRLEVATILLELAACRQREYLEATAIGKHGLLPCRKLMHATRLLDYVHTWAEVEVVGIGKDNLCLSLVLHIAMEDTLHRCGGTYGHKDWGLDWTMVGLDKTGTRLRIGRSILQCKFHSVYITCKDTKIIIDHQLQLLIVFITFVRL